MMLEQVQQHWSSSVVFFDTFTQLTILLLVGAVKQMVMTQNVNLNSTFLFKCEDELLVFNEWFGKS